MDICDSDLQFGDEYQLWPREIVHTPHQSLLQRIKATHGNKVV